MNTFTLKMIALTCMVIDHIRTVFPRRAGLVRLDRPAGLPAVPLLHDLGLSLHQKPRPLSAAAVSDERIYDRFWLCHRRLFAHRRRLWQPQHFPAADAALQQGKGTRHEKYFFYFFYPAHTFALFYLANFLLN